MNRLREIQLRWWPVKEANWSTYQHGSMDDDTYVIKGTGITIPFTGKQEAEFIANAPKDI